MDNDDGGPDVKQATRAATSRTGRLWLTAASVLAAGLAGVGAAVPASAAPNQYAPSIGTATGSPVSGSVATAPILVTSGLCPSGTTAINGFVDSAAAGLVTAVAIASNTTDIPNISGTGISFGFNLLDVAASQGKTLVNGDYEVSIVCLPDLFGTPGSGQFDAVFTVSGGATPTSAGTTYTFQTTGPAATTTTIAASPAGSAQQGAAVTLTATVSPSGATGAVQFQDVTGATPVDVGAPATVSGGSASVSVSNLSVGSHSLRAVFTPTDPATFGSSTSANLTYSITSTPATPTTTALTTSPAGTAVLGDPVTLTASVSPSGAAGTVQFEDVASGSPVSVGAPAAVTGGTATLTTSSLAQGDHSLQARFVPTDPAAFAASTSATVAYTITPPANPPADTSTTIAASPADAADEGGPVTLTATISPATAVGTVQFVDGPDGATVNVGSAVAVSAGTATLTTSTLAVGSHSLRAVFTPRNAADFNASTSAALAYTINAVGTPPTQTSTSIASSPRATATEGTAVTFTATVDPAAATGTVTFTDAFGAGATLGGPVDVAGGTASVSTSTLAVGTHQVTATFTPTDPAVFTGSSSVALGFTVTPADTTGATPTTTTLEAKRIGRDDDRGGHREWEGTGCDHRSGAGALLQARVSPRAAGTVQFFETFDGAQTPIGDPVKVRKGRSDLVVRPLGVGTHEFTAIFTPADPAAFQSSTSATAIVVIKPAKDDSKDDPRGLKDEYRRHG
jgi:hypothetical protein